MWVFNTILGTIHGFCFFKRALKAPCLMGKCIQEMNMVNLNVT